MQTVVFEPQEAEKLSSIRYGLRSARHIWLCWQSKELYGNLHLERAIDLFARIDKNMQKKQVTKVVGCAL